jgi:DNA-directed RNA polymerase subunit RPC12/RpoP
MVLNEVYCMECKKYFRFRISEEESGNLEIPCKNCGHMHFRVVEEGRITGDRWALDAGDGKPYVPSRDSMVTYAYAGVHTVSMYTSSTSASTFTTDSWSSTTTDATGGGYYYHPGAP